MDILGEFEILDGNDQKVIRKTGLDRAAQRSSKADLKRLNHKHLAIMDMMLYNPELSKTAIAKKLNATVSWVSLVEGSDLFQEEMRKKRASLDGYHRDRLQSRLLVAGDKALDRLENVLDDVESSDSVAVTASKNVLTALGFMGNNNGSSVNVQINNDNNQINTSPAGVTREMLEKAKDRRSSGE